MEIEFSLTEADVLALARYRFQSVPALQNRVKRLRLGYLVGFMVLAVGTFLNQPGTLFPLVFMILAVAIYTAYPAFLDWRLRRNVKAAFRDPQKQITFQSRKMRVSSDGLEEESSLGQIKVKWSAIDNYLIAPDRMYISVEQVPSMVIPRERISAGSLDQFASAFLRYRGGEFVDPKAG